MSKKLTSTKYPFLPLSVHVRVTNRKHIELDTQALIDTGFSGDVVVPASEELKQSPPDAYATWTMVDGSEVMAPIFFGKYSLSPALECPQTVYTDLNGLLCKATEGVNLQS